MQEDECSLLLQGDLLENGNKMESEMGANNWKGCPRCSELAKRAYKSAIEACGANRPDSEKAVGKAKRQLEDCSETLAKYYDFDITTSLFSMSYRCMCHRCGFTAKFEMSEDISQERQDGDD